MAVEALLHLSALAVIVPVAYLGFDRVRDGEDGFNDQLSDVSKRVRESLVEADVIDDGKVTLPTSWYMKEIFLLCKVADLKLDLGLKVLHWFVTIPNRFICSLYFIPGLSYFRNRRDRRVVVVFGGIAFMDFLFLTASKIWESQESFSSFANSHFFIEASYWVNAAILSIIFLSAAASYRLVDRLELNCNEWLKKVSDEINKNKTAKLNNLENAVIKK